MTRNTSVSLLGPPENSCACPFHSGRFNGSDIEKDSLSLSTLTPDGTLHHSGNIIQCTVSEVIVIGWRNPSQRTWRGTPHSTIKLAAFLSKRNLTPVAQKQQCGVQEELKTLAKTVRWVKYRHLQFTLAQSRVSSGMQGAMHSFPG